MYICACNVCMYVMYYNVTQCGAMRCGVMECDVMLCVQCMRLYCHVEWCGACMYVCGVCNAM